MNRQSLLKGLIAIVTVISLLVIVMVVSFAQDAEQTEVPEEDALLARGEYLARVARCVSCHTPKLAEFQADELTVEQEVTSSLFNFSTLDIENNLMAGGNLFNFGAAGSVWATNITPDEATGIGAWTDEEIEIALRIGVAPDGRRLHAIMPYNSYYDWPQSDMAAIIAYLHSIPAVENEVDRTGLEGSGEVREMPNPEDLPEAPPEELVARGEYLVNDVMRCTGCHTPRDPRTGQADSTLLMGGGQAFEREWGIVYGGNVTFDDATGIGLWEDSDVARVFHEGVRIDGRRLVLMPWQDYSVISDEDLDAVIAYLHSLDPVDNEVPAPSFENDAFEVHVDD